MNLWRHDQRFSIGSRELAEQDVNAGKNKNYVKYRKTIIIINKMSKFKR